MRKRITALLTGLLSLTAAHGQYPVESYQELPNPTPTDQTLWQSLTAPVVAWGSIDVRYPKEQPAEGLTGKELRLSGWRGERVYAQAIVSSATPLPALSYEISELRSSDSAVIPSPQGESGSGFVRYVLTDELNKDGLGGCGERPDNSLFDSTLVADGIDHLARSLELTPCSTRPIWFSIDIPRDARAGSYRATVTVRNGDQTLATLPLSVVVDERALPEKSDFFLDLWQNPYAIARYYGVTPWSEEHFSIMRPYMEMYRDAGGKAITASIIYKPWNGQTHDPFDSMIDWKLGRDGKWHFDYTHFDEWVSFMMDLGIDKAITCFSMVPWELSFRYFDEVSGEYKFLKAEPGSEPYAELWSAMLRSFAQHLRAKGWIDRTYIAMDERSPEVMEECFRLIQEADPELKVHMTGALHEELSDHLDYYCVGLAAKYSEELKAKRRSEGKITTFYTCCAEPRPNTFTFSAAADGEWYGWYAAREGLDGYLRWAYNSWVEQPLLDSRYSNWAAGDTYLVYPGVRSSIRFERLRRGIQAFDKIKALRSQYAGDRQALAKIDEALSLFDESKLSPSCTSDRIINEAREIIETL